MKKKKKAAKPKKVSKVVWWWGYIRNRARQVMKWSPEKRRVLAEAKGFCAGCKTRVEHLDADHIEPVVPVDKPFIGDWNTYFDRLFNGKLQALCSKCHDSKTEEERKLRQQHKKFATKEDSSSQEGKNVQ